MAAGIGYTLLGLLSGVLLWLLASGPDSGAPLPAGVQPAATEVERLHEIRDRMAAVRGLDLAGDVREGYLSRDSLSEYINDFYIRISDDDRRDLELRNIVLRMLRMIGPDDDLLEIEAASGSLGILGFYDHTEKSLVVVADELKGTLNEETTLAHEYAHALQDQHFDLQRFLDAYETEGTEYGMTVPCVAEGDASFAQVKYLEDAYGDAWIAMLFAELREDTEQLDLADELTTAVPPAILRYTYFRYNECANFVEAIWEDGGWEAVNALYERPPSTTEQVMHPERYLDDEEAIPLAADDLSRDLGLGWRLADSGVFGEFDVYNYLRTSGLGALAARAAAEGWGGGSMDVYTLGGGEGLQVLLHVALVWDSQSEFEEFEDALETALGRQGLALIGREEDAWVWADVDEEAYGQALWHHAGDRVDLLFGTSQAVVWNARTAMQATR